MILLKVRQLMLREGKRGGNSRKRTSRKEEKGKGRVKDPIIEGSAFLGFHRAARVFGHCSSEVEGSGQRGVREV